MWWGSEEFGSLTVDKGAFELRFHSGSIDQGVHNRVWIRRYVVGRDTVRRAQPVAATPRDFVDEWMVSPWTQAGAWSASRALPRLRQSHAEWVGKRKSAGGLLEFESVHRCSDRRDHHQVEIGEMSGTRLDRTRPFFFQVLGDRDYTMLQISEGSDKRCQGPDLLDEMKTK
jgi:hypothetical protein